MLDDLLSLEESGPLRVLLVFREKEAALQIRRRLEEDHDDVSITVVDSLGASLRTLEDEEFDVVVVDHDLPDGTSFDLLGRVDILDPGLPVIVVIDGTGEKAAIGVMKAGAADYVRRVQDRTYETEISFKIKEALHRYQLLRKVQQMAQEREQRRLIETVRSTVANVKHEVNNPLSIISGNAQLLQELARMEKLGDDFLVSLKDIEEASKRIASSIEKLGELKDILTRPRSEPDEPVSDTRVSEG